MRRASILAGLLLTVVSLIPAPAGAEPQSAAERQQMRDVLLQRVDEYVALHRRLEASLPPQIVTTDPERLLAPQIALAREMRKARAQAQQGDIFTPGVAVYLRVVIAETLRREGVLDMLGIIEEENEVHIPPAVNGDYPAGRATPFIPPCLLAALPPLPREVRYSFIGRDLILWDPHAGLIVDFVPHAVPVFTVTCP
jgi:hypothetical protein